MVTLGNVVQALFQGHVRRHPIEQHRRHGRGIESPSQADRPKPPHAAAKGQWTGLRPACGSERGGNLIARSDDKYVRKIRRTLACGGVGPARHGSDQAAKVFALSFAPGFALIWGQFAANRLFNGRGGKQGFGQYQREFGAGGEIDLRLRKVDDRSLDDPFGDRCVQLAAKKQGPDVAANAVGTAFGGPDAVNPAIAGHALAALSTSATRARSATGSRPGRATWLNSRSSEAVSWRIPSPTRAALFTLPDTTLPAAKTVSPSALTGAIRTALTEVPALLAYEPTVVVSRMWTSVPAGACRIADGLIENNRNGRISIVRYEVV